MDEHETIKNRFRVIKTYPNGDCIARVEYEGTIEELCIELSKYVGSDCIRNRRIMKKQLALYEQAHKDVHFEVLDIQSRKWKIIRRNEL